MEQAIGAKANLPIPTEVRWIPGHFEISGNEEADALAKAGAALPPPMLPPTPSWERRQITLLAHRDREAWWAANRPDSYKALDIAWPVRPPKELSLPRWPSAAW